MYFKEFVTTKNFLAFLAIEFLLIFAFNVIWENMHMPLYANHAFSWNFFPMSLWAAKGDVILSLFILIPFFFLWRRGNVFSTSAYAFLVVVGVIVGSVFEYYSLNAGRWSYSQFMPIVPLLQIGVTPAVQLGVVTPIASFLARKLGHHEERH